MRRRSRIVSFAAVMSVLNLLAGCARTPSAVGAWSVQGGPGEATMTFLPDGNFRVAASTPGRSFTITGQ